MSSQPHSLTPVRPASVDRLLAAALRDPADEALRQLVDSSLMAILFLAPLLMAGDHPWGRLLLVSLVIVACGMWAFHQARHRRAEWTRSGAEGLLLAGGGLLVLQLLPLPASWMAALSPNLADLLPLWTTGTSSAAASESLAAAPPEAASWFGSWRQLSLHPEATRTSLVMYVTCGALFLLVVQRVRSQPDIERLVRWVAIAALGMALLSMLQAMTRAEGLPWFFEHPRPASGEGLRGPFASSDQLAHFLALGMGPMIWWAWQLLRPARRRRLASVPRTESYEPLVRVLLLAAFAVLILAGTLTRSHAGFTLGLLSAAICGGVYWFRGLGKQRAAWALLVVASLTAMTAWAYGYEGLMRDVRALGGQQPAAANGLESSRLVWQAGMRAAAEFPIAGTGAGTAGDVLPIYLPSARAADDRLAENAYLRVFQEMGLAGFLLLLVGLGLVIRWTGRMVRRAESRDAVALGGAIAAALVASLLHALIEPVWGVPACMSLTVVLAGCACRLSQLVRGGPALRTTALARPVWIALVFMLLGLGLGLLHQMTPPALAAWDRDRFELQVARLIADQGPTAAQGAGSRDDLPAPVVAVLRRHLQRVLEYDRHDAAAHLQLARICVWEFQRLARSSTAPVDTAFAEAGQRRLSEARDLLREGLRICPVLGDGYGDLAELALLDGGSPEFRLACLRQAVRLRPREYPLRRALAEELLAAGSADESIEHFRWCLRQRPDDAHLQRRLAEASGRMWY